MTKQIKKFQNIIELIKDRVCRKICGDRIFNSDMSLEIDRLTIKVEELEERLREAQNEY